MGPSREGPIRIGFHVSIAGGLPKAVERAVERGCTAFQVFCGSPRSWALPGRMEAETSAFRSAQSAADLMPLVVHSCYLINPCADDRCVRRKSIARLSAELRIAAEMGAEFYVMHPGSNKGCDMGRLVQRAAGAIAAALDDVPSPPKLLLENTAAQHGPGGNMQSLGQLLQRLADARPDVHMGIAVDTCHAFAAGYDFREPDEVGRLIEDVCSHAGMERLCLLHVNDARDECGSKRDRHEHIGRGCIGMQGLTNLLTHPQLLGLPLILETPWETIAADRRNMRAVLGIVSPPNGH